MSYKLSRYVFQAPLVDGHDKRHYMFFSGRTAKTIVISERIKKLIENCEYDKLPISTKKN